MRPPTAAPTPMPALAPIDNEPLRAEGVGFDVAAEVDIKDGCEVDKNLAVLVFTTTTVGDGVDEMVPEDADVEEGTATTDAGLLASRARGADNGVKLLRSPDFHAITYAFCTTTKLPPVVALFPSTRVPGLVADEAQWAKLPLVVTYGALL